MTDLYLTNRHFADLNPLLLGREACDRGHSFGPAMRKYTLLHYVECGKGTLYKDGQAYPVGAGEVFVILPQEITLYRADERDPWVYRWIAFDGALSERFAALPPVFALADALFPDVRDYEGMGGGAEYTLAGALFRMMAELFGDAQDEDYVSRVKTYIKTSYMKEIRVEEIAKHLSLDRRYLTRLFKQKTGRTVQEYLLEVRMREACRHLSIERGVAEAARLCGYTDVCNFSKMFKRKMGVAPSLWRERTEEKTKEKTEV
ncbi:MAG: AraC family transcriptional regulator [Clostridia bacterium]|nr:AraC family transcriptional regulator [Clostridia bacterium]